MNRASLIWMAVALIWLPALSVMLSLTMGKWACRTHDAAPESCTLLGHDIGGLVHALILPAWVLPFTLPLMVLTLVLWLSRFWLGRV